MAHGPRIKLRGIAEPVLAREPLLVRLCSAFVDNLTLILRIAFVVGALLLVQDLRSLFEDAVQPVAEVERAPAIPELEMEPTDLTEVQKPVLSENVKHALNCTYEDYRNAHYDECVNGPSGIYLRPQADPDDTGRLTDDAQVLYARLGDYASLE